MKVFCAIDPGFEGFLCFLSETGEAKFFPMPLITTEKKNYKKGKKAIKIKRDIDGKALADIFKNMDCVIYKDCSVYLEEVHAMPNQGTVSMFNFGEGVGVIKGVLQALGYSFTLVAPQTWKNDLIPLDLRHLDKKASAIVGKQLIEKEGWKIEFPTTPRSKEVLDGASDAFCLAYYAMKQNIKDK